MRIPIDARLFGRGSYRAATCLAASLLCFLLLHAAAEAAQHPVPLPKNPDSAVCLGCHAGKAKGKHVHSAIAMGCTTCHAVTQQKDGTAVNLVSPAKQLCFSCHQKSTDKLLHGPYAQGNCLVCHSPHSSPWPDQLLASQQNLCMGCHVRSRLKINAKKRTVTVPWGVTLPLAQLKGAQDIGLNKALTLNHPVDGHPVTGPNKDVGNGAADITCLSCHQPHHSQLPNLLPPNLANETALCKTCHKNE